MKVETDVRTGVKSGVGTSAVRPDAVPKLTGDFAYSSDLYADGMLWGATRRSPHAHARITKLDIAPALAIGGVQAVLTMGDVPGNRLYGLEDADQPVLADEEVRFWGQAIALVAADDPEVARAAAEAIDIEYEVLQPLVDAEEAERAGSVFRRVPVNRGDRSAMGPVVVEGVYEVGMQDQAPLGTEAGLAVPDDQGGIDLYVSTQWIHADHGQLVEALGVEPDQIRVHLSGIGGAFGAREDVSLQIHLCLLANHTGKPVKMIYNRDESFVGHVHRHPAKMWYRHEALEDGTLVKVEAKLLIDGGAFTSTSPSVIGNATYFAVGPYNCPNVFVEGVAVRTNNPPCGAMRGFGAVQACFAHESQMDQLAAALGIDPLELRLHNALGRGDPNPTTGQIIEGSLPTEEVIRSLASMPLPDESESDDPLHLPGGTGLTTLRSEVVRGIGYGVSIKNIAFSEGFDDYADARVVLTPAGVEVHTAAAEVGQGLVTVMAQIARTVLAIEQVAVIFDDTATIGSSGSSSASRQTQVTGRAVHDAAESLKADLLDRFGGDALDGDGVWLRGELVATIDEICSKGPIESEVRFHHPPTVAPDANGQGDLHADFAVAAHRAVVDVDPELGLVHVVQVDTAQDVGKALNPQSVIGQIEGGILQGVGLAYLEELIVDRGVILNANFTDYLLATSLDAPDVEAVLIEEPGLWGPFGAKGVGEPPTISSTAAVVAAIRAATGKDLNRVPVRPEDVAL